MDHSSVWPYVEQLGRTVERLWCEQRRSEDRFPEVAKRALTEIPVPTDIDAEAVLTAAADAEVLVPQVDRANRFGQPPITLYRARDFFIDVLLWLDGTPAIHEHAFSGAFRVLAGASVHVPYRFEVQEVVSRRLMFGELKVIEGEILGQGDTRAIVASMGGIHSLFHLVRPSATVVVRTYHEPWAAPQRVFFRPGVAYDGFYRDPTLSRRLDAVAALRQVNPVEATSVWRKTVARSDPLTAFFMVEHWFKQVDVRQGVNELVDILVAKHGFPAELGDMFEDRTREASLLARRRMLHEPRHRLILAVLAMLPSSATRAEILGGFFPGEDPGRLLGELVAELASPALRGTSGLVLAESEVIALREALESNGDERQAQEHLRTLSSRVRRLDLVEYLVT